MASICTYTGKKFNYLDVKPEDICIEDIAHGLSNLCRYFGQCKRFYSVAEHCVKLSQSKFMSGDPKARLLHDAVEAYVGDVARPLKALLPEYQKIEARIQKVIEEKYDVDFSTVKEGDIQILEIEATNIMDSKFFEIHNSESDYVLEACGNGDVDIECWPPEYAEKMFLMRARELGIEEAPSICKFCCAKNVCNDSGKIEWCKEYDTLAEELL